MCQVVLSVGCVGLEGGKGDGGKGVTCVWAKGDRGVSCFRDGTCLQGSYFFH